MVLTGETIAILQGMLIEVNLSKSSRIAKSGKEKHESRYESGANGDPLEKVINIINKCHRIFGIFRITFIYDSFDKCKIDFSLSLSLFCLFFKVSRYEKLKYFLTTTMVEKCN